MLIIDMEQLVQIYWRVSAAYSGLTTEKIRYNKASSMLQSVIMQAPMQSKVSMLAKKLSDELIYGADSSEKLSTTATILYFPLTINNGSDLNKKVAQ